MSDCIYCGTKNGVRCCDIADKQYKDRIIALFRCGCPTNEQLEEMAEACLFLSIEVPEKMKNINKHVGG